MRHDDGTSLLELVVALAIGATLLTMLVWHSQRLTDSLSLRSAAVTLVADLRAAQAKAMAERRPDRRHGLEFRVGADRYAVVVQEGNLRLLVREQRLPSRVRITHARFGGIPAAVVFTGVSLYGAPSGGGTVTLTSGRARLCVRVLPATGRPRVSRANCP